MTEEATETVDVEPVEETAIVVRESNALALLDGRTPAEMIAYASEVATALADIINQKKLYKVINEKKFVYVEGWTLLGSLLGVFPSVEWTRPTQDGWEARVVARTRAGEEVGAGESMCSRRESKWKSADEYAIRSMAQTRATSKALRIPLGFVMKLAGYEATPESEITEALAAENGNGRTATAAPSNWPELLEAYDAALMKHPWQEWWMEVLQRKYEIKPPPNATFGQMTKALRTIKGEQFYDEFWQGCLTVLDHMPSGDLGPTRAQTREAFEKVFDVMLQGPLVSMSPDEGAFLPTYEMYVAGDHRPAAEASGSATGPDAAMTAEGAPGDGAEGAPAEPGGAETGPSDTAPSGGPGNPGVTAGAGLGEEVPAPSASELDESGFPSGY